MNPTDSKQIALSSLPIIGEARDLYNRGSERLACHRPDIFRFLFVLFFILYVPAVLIWTDIIPFQYRFHTLFCILAGIISYSFLRRYSFRELGFRTDNLGHSLRWNLLFCIFGAAGLYLIYRAGFARPGHPHHLPWTYGIYIFFLGPAQEIVFRGILFAEMKRIRILDKKLILLISTLSFCFLHIIYNYPPLLLITFVSGLIWGLLFIRCPNIWAISLSHSLLGALAMFFRLI
ncbi:MAG: CPBP family intramembrane metalloprotease [Desulfocapsaceae bacterium]|nr:CPBP family intramembrane metalloprotease [Desulfocapsaceae bacterium]